MASAEAIFVIPIRDESEKTLLHTLGDLQAVFPGCLAVLVDDRSTPTFHAEAERVAAALTNVRVRQTTGSGGAGAAMATGLRLALAAASAASWLYTVEADGSVPAAALVPPSQMREDLDVLFFHRDWGSRDLHFSMIRRILSRGASRLHRWQHPQSPPDWTLFYRGYRAAWLRRRPDILEHGPTGFEWQAWMAYRVLQADAAWDSRPVPFRYRRHAAPQLRRHARHIGAHLRLATQERRVERSVHDVR